MERMGRDGGIGGVQRCGLRNSGQRQSHGAYTRDDGDTLMGGLDWFNDSDDEILEEW